jgi:hypothetical protein
VAPRGALPFIQVGGKYEALLYVPGLAPLGITLSVAHISKNTVQLYAPKVAEEYLRYAREHNLQVLLLNIRQIGYTKHYMKKKAKQTNATVVATKTEGEEGKP